MAARFVMGRAAAHGSCGGCAVRTRVGRQAQAVHCIAQVFSARSQQRHARFHCHHSLVGLLLRCQIIGACLRGKNQIAACQGCFTFPFQSGSYLVLGSDNSSYTVTKTGNQCHLLIGS